MICDVIGAFGAGRYARVVGGPVDNACVAVPVLEKLPYGFDLSK